MYDSAVEDAFIVHVAPEKTIKFACNESKLVIRRSAEEQSEGLLSTSRRTKLII